MRTPPGPKRDMKIPFIRPTLPEPQRWTPYLEPSYRSKIFSNSGPVVNQLEEALREKYAGPGKEVLLVANATAGLTAAIIAAGVKGKVLVPAFTFSASAHAIVQAGCAPVFCDVSSRTWELTADILEAAMDSEHISAIMPVRSFGLCRDFAPLEAVARKRGIPLILDSASAMGGRLPDGSMAGSQGDVEVFSLHATKVFAVGEGGAIFCDRDRKEQIKRTCNFGQQDGAVIGAGLNGKMSDFHAAVGLAVLEDIDRSIAHRWAVADVYRKRLAGLSWLTHAMEGGAPPYQTYPVLIETPTRAEQVVENCGIRGVQLRRYYRPALHEAQAFAEFTALSPTNASDLASRMVCLPVYSDMTADEQSYVIDILLSCGA